MNTNITSKLKVAVAALVAVVAGVIGTAAPAAAAVQTYHSTPINGMWHSGNVQFWNANTKVNTTIYFNDRTGDAYCTRLMMKATTTTGASTTFNQGSVCGGRSGTLSNTITAAYGYRLASVEIWTIRADGAVGSYHWTFRP